MTEVVRFALLGLGVGAAYVLIGQGIVLIYRGSGILNFAQGAVAMVAAEVFYNLRDDGYATVPALVISLAIAAGIGAGFQIFVLRKLKHTSALIRLISTLGLLAFLQGLGIVAWGDLARPVDGFLPTGIVDFGNKVMIGQDRVYLFGIGLVLTTILWIVYQRTRYGLATSAVAENQDAAVALGWSPDTISAANWALGSILAGLAGILLVPLSGLSVSGPVLLVIPGLATALIGGFASFWLTLLGGLAIGVVQSEMLRYVHTPGWSDAVPFIVIIALVVFRGRALPLRGEFIERPVHIGTGLIRPKVLVPVVVLAGLVIHSMSGNWVLSISTSALVGTIALSLVIVTGYAGQISLAQLTIAGVGALAAANASAKFGWPFELCIVFGAVVAALVGVVVALPALRCRGVNLAVATIGLSTVIEGLIFTNSTLTSQSTEGLVLRRPRLLGIDIESLHHPIRYAVVVFLLFVGTAILIINVRRGRTGRRLLALRANERAAAACGVNVFAGKMYAFGVGAAIGGFAGAIGAFEFSRLNLSTFSTFNSMTLLVQTVIGGIGFVGGAIVGGSGTPGGLVSQVLANIESSWNEYLIMVSGILVLLTLVAHPNGVSDTFSRITRGLIHRLRAHFGRRERTTEDEFGEIREVKELGVRGRELVIRGLSVSFGGVRAVNNVDLDVRPGEVVGLIGPNGAGKTTVIDAVTGLVRSMGTVTIGERSLRGLSPRRRALSGLGRTFQGVELFNDMTVLDNIRTAADSRGAWPYLVDLVLPRSAPLPPVARAAIRDLRLVEYLDHLPDELPAGRQRMVGIARMLALGPSVVLLDEPAAGLNDEETRELGELIRHLAEQWGLAVLLIEHDVDLVTQVSDRVVALALGEVIAQGTPQEVLHHEAVVSAYLGGTTDEEPTAAPVVEARS